MNLQCIKINDMTQLDWYIPFEVICRKVPVDKKKYPCYYKNCTKTNEKILNLSERTSKSDSQDCERSLE